MMKATDMLPVLGAALDTFVAIIAKNKNANADKYLKFTIIVLLA
tara:strand:- start:1524 stop:1655 length:132 start_codon:yes stop_codon:yes gene_type:complete